MIDGKVFLSDQAFFDMISHCLRRGNPELGIRLEVHGYLIGYNQNQEDIMITKVLPMKHGTPSQVQLHGNDYVIAVEKLDKILKDNKKEFLIGWYHSHPNLSIFLSNDDNY